MKFFAVYHGSVETKNEMQVHALNRLKAADRRLINNKEAFIESLSNEIDKVRERHGGPSATLNVHTCKVPTGETMVDFGPHFPVQFALYPV